MQLIVRKVREVFTVSASLYRELAFSALRLLSPNSDWKQVEGA